MDPVLKFVLEAACLVGLILLAAVSTPGLGGKRWDRLMWLRSTGVLVVGLVYLVVNPRGAPDMFPVVIGCTAFVVALVAFLLAVTWGWRFAHRCRTNGVDRQTAINFGAAGLFVLMATVLLVGAVASTVGIVQNLADQSAYDTAPSCTSASASSCRSQVDGTIVRTWAESSRGPHWIEVTLAGGDRTIQISTAYDVWDRLVPGERVQISSWKGKVTAVQVPGGGTMETDDSPHFGLIMMIGFLVASLFGWLIFSVYGLIYGLKWWAGTRGIDTSDIAA